jgi:hypothetical protein
MPRRRSREGLQSNSLEESGMGHEVPTPDFSDQPDSGGRIGGVRGRQEFGIEGGPADELESEISGKDEVMGRSVQDLQADLDSMSEEQEVEEGMEEEPRQEGKLNVTAPQRAFEVGGDLQDLIEDRLLHHPSLHFDGLRVSVWPAGLVTVAGRVRSESEKLRVTEIIGALPGVEGLRNVLIVG